MIRVAVLTASDKGSIGERKDTSSEVVREMISEIGGVVSYAMVPDDRKTISEKLIEFCDDLKADLVLTTGGTGFGPRDVTPEATKDVIEKEIPGIPEAMRMASFSKVPNSILSRSVAGIRKNTLIVNLPGSPKGVRETLEIVIGVIPHAIRMIRGDGH